MDQTPAVRARKITKIFGDVVALDGIDLDIGMGQVHGLVGPNGAGKTTLLGLLLGLAVADSGRLDILGSRVGSTLAVPPGVSGFVDGPGLYPSLTARNNLVELAALQGCDPAEVDLVLADVGLREVADGRVRGFSLGMRQRLGLAAALLTRPRLLVLDEPANGLDPAGRRHVHRVLERLATDGTAVVLSSHRMDELADLCTDVTILSAGHIAFSGPMSELAEQAGDLDHRLRTTRPVDARRAAESVPGVRVLPGHADVGGTLVVRGRPGTLDELISVLVGAGIAIREFAPVVTPLEAAFLALTDDDHNDRRYLNHAGDPLEPADDHDLAMVGR